MPPSFVYKLSNQIHDASLSIYVRFDAALCRAQHDVTLHIEADVEAQRRVVDLV